MNPGQFNLRVSLKYPVSASIDRYGQSIMAYSSSSLWVNVKPQSGAQNNNGGLIQNNATYLFTFRENDNITDKAIITYAGKEYDIGFIDDSIKGLKKVTGVRKYE